jgi:outer membrane protein assembly factor BamB
VNKNKKTILGVTLLVVAIYTGVIVWWHVYTPHSDFYYQLPGADNRPEGLERTVDDVRIGEFFMRFVDDYTPTLTGQWTTFRGENHDNIIRTSLPIIVPEEDYPVLWHITTGEGYAAPVIFNGKVYLLDYDEDLRADMLRVFSLETGQELWRRWYRVEMRRNHGFSRTVPAVGEGFIATIGPMGHVMVCDPITGEMLWSLNMEKEFNAEIPRWFTGQCPLVYNGQLILAPGGEEILMLGADVMTGEILWTVPNTLNMRMSHSSIIPITIHGQRTFVYISEGGGTVGVSAEGDNKGTLLWSNTEWRPTQVSPSPLLISASDLLLTAGYGKGGARLRVNRSGNNWTATIVEQYTTGQGAESEQQTPILFNNMIITVLPADAAAPHRFRIVMYTPTDLRTPVWASAERFRLGPYIVINDYLFMFNDDGELFVYRIEARSMTLLKRQEVVRHGVDAWGPIAFADGILIVGDNHNIKALRIINDE